MKWRSMFIYLAVLAIGFYGGYCSSAQGLFDRERIDKGSTNSSVNQDSGAVALGHAWQIEGERLRRGNNTSKLNPSLSNGIDDSQQTPSEQANDDAEPYAWQDENDIIAMFNQLMTLSEPVSDEDVAEFGRAIDEFRAALANSDTQIAILVDYMTGLDPSSIEFSYIAGMIAGVPDQKGYAALESVALTLAQSNEPATVQQFLDILNTTYNSTDNPEVISALMDIALYSELPDDTKLRALDYVQPFQISSVEKQEIQSNLNTLLNEAPVAEKSVYLNHVLRFSSEDERLQLANTYIDREQDQELRLTVIDRLSAGTVPRTNELREKLMTIATSPDDPLSEYAQHTLMYSFDITNEEYQRLTQSSWQ